METKKRIVNARITNIFTFPESCPIGNPKNPQTMMKWLKKVDTIATKHGLSVVGIWTDRWGHKTWAMYDSPNMEAFEEFDQEPENLDKVTFNNIETRTVTIPKET